MPSRTTRSLEWILAPDPVEPPEELYEHCPCLSLPFYLNLPHGWRFQIVEVQYQVEHFAVSSVQLERSVLWSCGQTSCPTYVRYYLRPSLGSRWYITQSWLLSQQDQCQDWTLCMVLVLVVEWSVSRLSLLNPTLLLKLTFTLKTILHLFVHVLLSRWNVEWIGMGMVGFCNLLWWCSEPYALKLLMLGVGVDGFYFFRGRFWVAAISMFFGRLEPLADLALVWRWCWICWSPWCLPFRSELPMLALVPWIDSQNWMDRRLHLRLCWCRFDTIRASLDFCLVSRLLWSVEFVQWVRRFLPRWILWWVANIRSWEMDWWLHFVQNRTNSDIVISSLLKLCPFLPSRCLRLANRTLLRLDFDTWWWIAGSRMLRSWRRAGGGVLFEGEFRW